MQTPKHTVYQRISRIRTTTLSVPAHISNFLHLSLILSSTPIRMPLTQDLFHIMGPIAEEAFFRGFIQGYVLQLRTSASAEKKIDCELFVWFGTFDRKRAVGCQHC